MLEGMQQLQAEKRLQLGRKAGVLRKNGLVPAVVYGEGIPSQPITVPQAAFGRVWKQAGESTLVELKVGEKPYTVLIHDIAYDPLTSRPIHADFYAVRMDKALRVTVPLEFAGESSAVKNEGGVLVKVAHELEIEAMPGDLPHALSVDLSPLVALGGRILVKDIRVPQGVKVLAPLTEVIVIVEAPRSEEELALLATAPVAELAQVKTEQEMEREAKVKAEGENSEEK